MEKLKVSKKEIIRLIKKFPEKRLILRRIIQNLQKQKSIIVIR